MVWNFTPEEFATLTMEEAIGQAVGAASVCWSNPEGAGLFQEDAAMEVVRALSAFIDSRAGEERPLLGLATTRDLLNELKVRGEISGTVDNPNPWDGELLSNSASMLLLHLPKEVLDYRTVGSV